MKKDRFGQAHPLSKDEYLKIRKNVRCDRHRLILDIAYYTGERAGAILQLEVSDVFETWNKFKPRRSILFKAKTRKDGKTREVPIHQDLHGILLGHKPIEGGYLFQSPKNAEKHLTLRAYDALLKRAVGRALLSNKGISTHSFRRGFIQQLHKKGVDLRTIQSVMGYASLSMLTRYIDINEDMKASAIANLD